MTMSVFMQAPISEEAVVSFRTRSRITRHRSSKVTEMACWISGSLQSAEQPWAKVLKHEKCETGLAVKAKTKGWARERNRGLKCTLRHFRSLVVRLQMRSSVYESRGGVETRPRMTGQIYSIAGSKVWERISEGTWSNARTKLYSIMKALAKSTLSIFAF